MKHAFRLALSLVALASPAFAQNTPKLKQELKTKEAAAKKDPDALVEVGKWAAEKSLAADAKRLFMAALKIKPDHAGANEALGNVLVEGKWLPQKEAEDLRKKAMAAEYAAKGFVLVDGIWVDKDEVADAKKGIFHHDQELVTKEEMQAFASGKVRHPVTGELIDAKFLDKAKNRYFPIGSEGRWVDEKEADQYHSDIKRPWNIRSNHCNVLSTLPIAKIDALLVQADMGYERVAPLLGSAVPSPTHRPVIVVADSSSQYTDMGKGYGDGSDAAGVFLVDPKRLIPVPLVGEVRAAICSYEKDWLERYVRHAAAIAYAESVAEDVGADLPLWLLHGFGSYTSRFQEDHDAAWFAKQHIQKGGVRNLKGFLSGFAITGDMEAKDVAYNLFQAGLLVRFAATGGNAQVTEAMQAVSATLSGKSKGSVGKAISTLEALLIQAEPQIAQLCQDLAAKSQ